MGLHYRGIEFIENDAVPVAQLRRCLTRARGLLETNQRTVMNDPNKDGTGSLGGGAGVPGVGGGVTFTVPLRITVEIGGTQRQPVVLAASAAAPVAAAAGAAVVSAAAPVASPTQEQVQAAVRTARAQLANREDVVAVKPGYRFENGEITDQRAIVIAVRRKVEKGALESRGVVPLPDYIDGVRTDVTVASTADLLGLDAMTEAFTPSWHTNYVNRPDLPLKRRKTKARFIVHSSPDAGWPQLGDFFAKTKKSLVIAMYDVGAVNVVEGLLDAVKGKTETVSMVLQMGGKVHKEDFSDSEVVDKLRRAKKSKFDFAPASVGKTGIFDSAYHIKVAVRDHAAMWLSSGNWQISNQPNVAPLTKAEDASALRLYNREWHAILEDAGLSKLFEAHILRDLADARAVPEAPPLAEPLVLVPADMEVEALEAAAKPRYFEPLIDKREIDVQPILTPDNYIDVVVDFIKTARRTICFQNQSFGTKTIGGRYRELLDALLVKQKEGVDLRIIFRSFGGADDRDVISNAKDFGFETKRIRKQKNCHTKGIVIDGEAVLMGSHNWTTAGTNFNRDASLIFYDRDIAKFFETLFDYDWERIGPAKIDESVPPPILVMPGNEASPPPGYIAVPLSTLRER